MIFVVKIFLTVIVLQSYGLWAASSFFESTAFGIIRRFCSNVSTRSPVVRTFLSWPCTAEMGISDSIVGQRRFYSSTLKKHSVQISHPCIDGVFQHGFAEPSILSDFLNAVLELKDGQTIEDIQYLPKGMPSADPSSPLGYHFTVDVRCRTREGRHFLVEMQNDFRDDYHLKSLVEHARMVSRLDVDQTSEDQVKQSETNKNNARKFWKGVQGLYAIVITNKAFPLVRMKEYYAAEPVMEPLLINPYELRHTKQLDRHYGDVPSQIVLLMLDNLKKSVGELSTPIERWAYLFKDPALRTGVKRIPEVKEILDPEVIAGPDKAITAFIERVKVENLPWEVRDQYLRAISYYNTTIVDIEEKAEERGLQRGLKEGEKAKARDVARILKEQKADSKLIVLSTGLTEEEIRNL